MMNDPLGLFEDENNNDPLGLFEDQGDDGIMSEVKRRGKAALGGLDAALTTAAQAIPYAASGAIAAGSIPFIGANEAENFRKDMLETGFGLGGAKPVTKEGEEILGAVGDFAGAIKEAGGEGAAKFAREGQYGDLGEGAANAFQLGSDLVLGAWGSFTPIPGGRAVRRMGDAVEKFGSRNIKNPTVEAALKRQAEIDAAKAASTEPKEYTPPANLRDELGLFSEGPRNGIPATRTDMLNGNPANAEFLGGAREREAAIAKRRAEVEAQSAAEQQAAREYALKLYNEELQSRLAEINEKLNKGEDVKALVDKYNAQYADFQQAKRQAEMEFEVKKQAGLDFNAAERARQEAAPVPGLEELKARQAQEQRAAQEQAQRLQEARQRDEITAQEFQKQLTDLSHKIEQLRAQHQIELRQKQMEMDVARQRSLDFNAQERARQEQAPVPGVESVLDRAQQTAAADPTVQAAEAKLPAVEERAVDSGAYGDMHSKFMEESLRVAEQNVQSLKNEIADTVRKNPIGIPLKDRPISSRGKAGRQRGAIDTGAITDALKKALHVLDPHAYISRWEGAFDPRAWSDILDDIRDPKSRQTLILMSPRDFHRLADPRGKDTLGDAPRLHANIREGLSSEKGLRQIPQLWTTTNEQGIAKVTGHEGRHRMDVFRDMGLTQIPVILKDSNYRWGGNDPYSTATKPKMLRPQWLDSDTLDIPVPQNFHEIKRIPLKQRGAVGNLNPGKKSRTIIDDLKDRFGKEQGKSESFIPDDLDPAEIIARAYNDKDGIGANYLESGSDLTAEKRKSALIKGVSQTVQNHKKAADLEIRENVFPVESALRSLSKKELSDLSSIMKQEMLQGKRFDPDALPFNKKQLEAYAHMRKMFDDTLRIQNEARAAKGQPPITEMEAYMSSRWDGDFRRPVYEAVLDEAGNPKIKPNGEIEGKLVWYLAANTKMGLEKQWKALKKDRPDVFHYPEKHPLGDHTVRYYKRQTDLQSVLSTVLDIIGRNDEALSAIKAAVEAQTINEAASFLGQEKHFKEKTGVRGFVGDRPGKSGKFSEDLAFFQQQIQYAKNAYNWSEMQKAGQVLKDVFADETLNKTQPNNMKYAKEYFKNNVGWGESATIAHLEDSLRNLGVSPTLLGKGIGGTKSFFLLQKLAVNTGYSIAGIIQAIAVFPHMMRLYAEGYVGNPVTAVASAVAGGLSLATGHYASLFTGGHLTKGIGHESAFYKKAFKYAEDNGVTARSLMDEAPIEKSFSIPGQIGKGLATTLTIPEVAGRSMAYMFYVEFLRSSGKFKGNDIALFQKAESLVNQSMVDYRGGERPMVFSKLGTVGDLLNTLQTFPMSWYQQHNLFFRDLMRGNPMPIMTAFAVQYGVAGLMGIPGFQDLDKLYQLVKNHMVPNNLYGKLREHPFWNDPKVWMMKEWGNDSVYGWLSDKSGIGITSRVAAPGLGDMFQSPGGPALDIGKQGVQGLALAFDPTNKDKQAQFAMSFTPPGLQGNVEQAPYFEGSTFDYRQNEKTGQKERIYMRPGNIESHTGTVTRTPEEETLRRFGLRSQRETVERELGYRTAKDQEVGRKRARDMVEEIYSLAKQGKKDRVAELVSTYTKLTGQELTNETFQAQVDQNFFTTMERNAKKAEKNQMSIADLKAYTRALGVMEQVLNERKQRGTR